MSRRWLALVALAVGAAACAAPAPEAGGGAAQDALVQPGPAAPVALGGFAALPAALSSDQAIVPECVPTPGPPYQIGAVGSFTGGAITLIPGVSVDALSGTFCAKATVVPAPPDRPGAKVCAELVTPAEGLKFSTIQTKLNLIPEVTSIIGDVTISPEQFTALICDDDQPGPIAVRTTVEASAVPNLFGTACKVGPLQADVTGSITGSLKDFTATLSSGPFPVTAVQSGQYCPPGLADNTNAILGLPLQASVTGLSLQVRGALYLPPQPPT